MSEQEKQTECERICGPMGKSGLHRIAPEMCPIKQEEWWGVRKPPDRGPR